MSTIRLVLVWLLMAALPLQGTAAASMLFCGSQSAARIAQAASHHGHHESMETTAHDHAAHGQDESAHASHEPQEAGHAVDQVAAHSAEASGETAQSHSCPVCAACSQAQAVGGFDSLPLASPAPSAQPSPPAVRIASRALTLPDKPPRA